MNDLRHALRALARSPGFALAVVLSLALGIGTDVTMLGLVDSLLFRPPAHVRDVDRLVDIRVRAYPDYVDLRDQTRSFSGVAGWWAPPRPYAISDGDRVVPVQQMLTSASLFPVLGVQPALGRFYTSAEDRPEPQLYVPFTRNVWGHMSLVVRTAVTPATFLATLTRTVRQFDPCIPMTSFGGRAAAATLDVTAGLESRQLDTWLLGSFAASALILAAIGIYGLLAYSVGQRRRELGIRLALGASRGDVVSQIVGDGVRLAGVGIGLGVVIALVVTRLLAALLFGVRAGDPPTFLGVVALLTLVSLLASYLPARRAAQLDPLTALRSE